MGKERTLFSGEMTPLVRSTSRQKWQRMPRRLVFVHRSVAHRGRRVLSLAFGFDREDDVYQFAAAAPYSYSRLQKHLAAWEKSADVCPQRAAGRHHGGDANRLFTVKEDYSLYIRLPRCASQKR
ncbi:hypothetical protein EVAR_3220_1 [Eumeta japonica]|uniref:Uncharacterized protein n=1 Tax=Eumeta variegata TaxID=151549 RepID=A0A4C1SUV0_EUMVA|nr:hypothetical protein EVAR_3220_1 [Eumeta japonica]